MSNETALLTLALPKGRLLNSIQQFFARRGLKFDFGERALECRDSSGLLRLLLVKNSDLPTYVRHGVAGLGICGSDILHEHSGEFCELHELPFGATRLCLACRAADWPPPRGATIGVATKYPTTARHYLQQLGLTAQIIKLNGSVELAPLLGLAPYIIDLVDSGATLKANHLTIAEELEQVKIYLIANRAYYKFHYQNVDTLIERLRQPD